MYSTLWFTKAVNTLTTKSVDFLQELSQNSYYQMLKLTNILRFEFLYFFSL